MVVDHYTLEELTAAVAAASPDISGENRPQGMFDASSELGKIQATAAASLLADPDSVLFLHKLAKIELESALTESLKVIDSLKTALANTNPRKAPSVKQKDWLKAHRNARHLKESPNNTAAQEDLDTALDSLTRQLGTSPERTAEETNLAAQDQLGSIVLEHSKILTGVDQLPKILDEYASSGLPRLAVAAQAAQTEKALDGLASAEGQTKARENSVLLQANKALLENAKKAADPLADKAAGTFSATGTSTAATVTGSRSAPFDVPSASKTLTYRLDGAAQPAWDLPTSTAPEFRSRNLSAGVDIRLDSSASVVTEDQVGGWNLVRDSDAGTFQVSGNVAHGSQDLAAQSIVVGDVLWLGQAARITAISGKTALLDVSPVAGSYGSVVCFKDERLTVLIDGVETILTYPFTAGTTLVTSIQLDNLVDAWSSQLADPDQATSTFTHVTLKSLLTGPTSSVHVSPGPMYTLLGFSSQNDSDTGKAANHRMAVKVVTAVDPDGTVTDITLDAGAPTAAQLRDELNGKLSGKVTASVDGDVLVLKGTIEGSLSEITFVDTTPPEDACYGELALEKDAAKRGKDVDASQLEESAKENFAGVLEFSSTTGPDLGTSAAVGAPTATVSFPNAGQDLFDDLSAGDVFQVSHASGLGNYVILSTNKSLRTITLATQVPTNNGGYTPTILKRYPTFTSPKTDKTSSIEFQQTAGKDVPELLGLVDTVETRGKTESISVGSTLDLTTQRRPEVKVGDLIAVGNDELNIVEIAATSVKVDPRPDNDISGAGTIIPLGASGLLALLGEVAAWRKTLSVYEDLADEFLPDVVQRMEGRDPVGAKTSIEAYETLLLSLQTILADTAWDALEVPAVNQILGTLRSRGLDRAEDLVRTGRLSDFLALTDRTASYKQRGLAAMAEASAMLQQDRTEEAELYERPAFSADADTNFPDIDPTETQIGGVSLGEEL